MNKKYKYRRTHSDICKCFRCRPVTHIHNDNCCCFKCQPRTPTLTLEELLVEEGTAYTSSAIKKRILQAELLVNECSVCGLLPEWNGKKLTLQLDHINGEATDWRIENLRMICPNCHTQTDTFCGENIGNGKRSKTR